MAVICCRSHGGFAWFRTLAYRPPPQMRREAVRILGVAAVGMSVEAFMQPGLRGGLQLKQVALTCPHVFCQVCLHRHENLASGCVSASCDAIGPCHRCVAWSARPCWSPLSSASDHPRRTTSRQRRPGSHRHRPLSEPSAQPWPPFWASFSPCLRRW